MVTWKILDDLGACEEGMRDFEAIFGRDAAVTLRGTQFEQGLILAHPQLRRWWGWLVASRLVPAWGMAELDLSGADLCRANLSGAYLEGADLSGAIGYPS